MPVSTVESTYRELPLLITHGAVIWKALVVLAAVAAPGLALLRRRRRVASQTAFVVDTATSALIPGPIALRGRMSGAGLCSSRQQVWGYPAPHATPADSGDARLVVGDVSVRLDGDVNVTAGTRASVNRRAGRTREAVIVAWRQELSVVESDEVVCVGHLTEVLPGEWTLRGRDAAPLELRAIEPRGAAEPTSRVRLGMYAVMAGAGMLLGLFVLGLAMERRMEEAARNEEASAADIPLRVQLAAMTPSGRDSSLRWLATATRDPIGRGAIGRTLAIGRLLGTDELPKVLWRLQRYDELLALARARADDDLAYAALVNLGRFDEAADLQARVTNVDRDLAVRVMVAAGRWSEAATLAESEAADVADASRQEEARCFAALFRVRAGDPTAEVELRAAAEHSLACRVIASEVGVPLPDRYSPVPRVYRGAEDHVLWAHVARMLDGAAGAAGCSLRYAAWWHLPYVAMHRPPSRGCVARWQLVTRSGSPAAADLGDDALYSPATALADSTGGFDVSPALRAGIYDPDWLHLNGLGASLAVRVAIGGDARLLASRLERVRMFQAHDIALGVAPRLHIGREALAESLLWVARDDLQLRHLVGMPGNVLQLAFRRWTVMHLLGRDDLATAEAATIDRIVAVLTQRDRLVALALWSER